MPFNLLHDTDWSSIPNAGPVGANALLADGWHDLNGGIWQVSSGALESIVSSGQGLLNGYVLYRPSDGVFQDQQMIVDYPVNFVPTDFSALTQIVLRFGGTAPTCFAYTLFFTQTQYQVRATGSLIQIGSLGETLNPAHTYEATFSAVGVNPTTLTVLIVDTTTDTTIASWTGTDSTANLQNATGFEGIVAAFNSDPQPILVSRLRTYSSGSGGVICEPLSVASQSATHTVLNQGGATGGTPPYTFNLYRSSKAGFTPGGGNLIASTVTFPYTDSAFPYQVFYVCIATDSASATGVSPQLLVPTYLPPAIIGFIGDSITSNSIAAGPVDPGQACAAFYGMLRTLKNVTPSVDGVEGAKSVDWISGSANLTAAIFSFTGSGVTIVSYMIGANDCSIAVATPAATYASHVASTIAALVTAGFTVIVNAPMFVYPDGSTFNDASNALLEQYSAALAALVDGVHSFVGDTLSFEWFGNNQGQLADGLHPNAVGIQSLGLFWAAGIDRALNPSSGGGSPPAITNPLTSVATVGVAFAYQVTASNSPTSFGATGLPAGLSVNTSTGLISGTPTTAGIATVTVSASNVEGTGSQLLFITIGAASSSIPESSLEQDQLDIYARLQVDPFFRSGVPVLLELKGITERDVALAISTANQQSGKVGTVVIVLMPKLIGESPNAPGPRYDAVYPIQIIDRPVMRRQAIGGTTVSADEGADRIREIIHRFTMGRGQTIYFSGMETVAVPEGNVSYVAKFKRTAADQPPVSVATVGISPSSGTGPLTVTLTCATAGASIWYTTDGSYPGSNSVACPTAQLYTGPFSAPKGATVRAAAELTGYQQSQAIAQVIYS